MPTDAQRVAEALTLVPPPPGGVRVVAVDGRSGSGKSTFAAGLGRRLDAPVVPLEEIYPGWDGLEDGIDLLGEWVIGPLARGDVARWRRWDWECGEFGAARELEPSAIVVVEGVGTGALRLAPDMSLLVWLELDAGVRYERAMERDGELFRPHWHRWAEQEERYLERDRPQARADVTVAVQ